MAFGKTFGKQKGYYMPSNLQTVAVNVAVGQTVGTATVPAGAVILGHYPAGNKDQHIDNIAISGTTLTVTLAAAATAINNIKVTVLGQ